MALYTYSVALAFSLLLLHPTVWCQSPSTFWNDYPACQEQCHQNVWANQQCSLTSICGCASGTESGCLCLADSCLCATSSWLTAVAQCIGQECDAAAVTQAASIAASGCAAHTVSLAIPTSELISIGLAAMSSAQTSMFMRKL